LKPSDNIVTLSPSESHPAGVRGLKLLPPLLAVVEKSRTPQGCVD